MQQWGRGLFSGIGSSDHRAGKAETCRAGQGWRPRGVLTLQPGSGAESPPSVTQSFLLADWMGLTPLQQVICCTQGLPI